MKIPKKMKAAILLGPDDLKVVETDTPKPEMLEVLIEVKACNICGTDPSLIAEGKPYGPPLDIFIPGHEYSGQVVALGVFSAR